MTAASSFNTYGRMCVKGGKIKGSDVADQGLIRVGSDNASLDRAGVTGMGEIREEVKRSMVEENSWIGITR